MCETALQSGHHCSVCSEFSGEVNVQISSDISNVYLKAKKNHEKMTPVLVSKMEKSHILASNLLSLLLPLLLF